jgi:hypothetical protein
MLYDYSYCLNRALWDDYGYTSYDHDVLAFLNHHHKAFLGATETELQSFDQAAQKMAILGAFNVNGTSIEAWTAFLASTMGVITGDTNYAEYSRIQSIDSTSNTEPSNIGLRRLTKTQIRALATAIVAQVKKRGVAGSIGAFVNRQLIKKDQDTDKFGLKGTIQAAIDSTTINDGFGGNTDLVTSACGKNWFDDEAASGPYWAGKPGYLTQADVLQSTSTTLCARGDTFCIYAYGNALDKNGTIEAEVRCEVIVQRMPEFLDPAKPQLGRSYKILAIRWITPSREIAERISEEHVASTWFGITNAISRNNMDPTLAHITYSDRPLWAVSKPGEMLTLATYQFTKNVNATNFYTAANSFASLLNGMYGAQSYWPSIKQDPVIGEFFSKTLSSVEGIKSLFSGGSTSIADVRSTIVEATSIGQALLNSSSIYNNDFNNTINALKAMDSYSQANNVYISSVGDNNNKNKLAPVFNANLNGTALTSVGAKIASLLVTLDSVEEALNAYEQNKP